LGFFPGVGMAVGKGIEKHLGNEKQTKKKPKGVRWGGGGAGSGKKF